MLKPVSFSRVCVCFVLICYSDVISQGLPNMCCSYYLQYFRTQLFFVLLRVHIRHIPGKSQTTETAWKFPVTWLVKLSFHSVFRNRK